MPPAGRDWQGYSMRTVLFRLVGWDCPPAGEGHHREHHSEGHAEPLHATTEVRFLFSSLAGLASDGQGAQGVLAGKVGPGGYRPSNSHLTFRSWYTAWLPLGRDGTDHSCGLTRPVPWGTWIETRGVS